MTSNSNSALVERQQDDAVAIRQAETLPPDLMLMRMENEQIMSVAASRPRDYTAIQAELISELDAFPQSAATAVYQKPVGKDEHGQMQFARGLSIRAAESIAVAFGYNRVSCDIEELDGDKVKITATFVDYSKGRIWQDSEIVSKLYKSRGGRMVRHNDDRFYNVIVNAAKSKRIREVILRCVPGAMKTAYMAACEKTIDTLLNDSTADKIIASFATKGITLEDLEERVIGKARKLGWTAEDRKRLQGLWTALENDEATVAEILGDEMRKVEKQQPTPDGKVTAEDFVKQPEQPLDKEDDRISEQECTKLVDVLRAHNIPVKPLLSRFNIPVLSHLRKKRLKEAQDWITAAVEAKQEQQAAVVEAD